MTNSIWLRDPSSGQEFDVDPEDARRYLKRGCIKISEPTVDDDSVEPTVDTRNRRRRGVDAEAKGDAVE